MHVYFSGIGGTAIASLALIAHEGGYDVSGSDARPSSYLDYLAKHGITNTHIGVDDEFIARVHAAKPIDWFVYGSAQPMDFPDHPEFKFCESHGIKQTKRDELLNQIIKDKSLKLIAVAGTHGKTTTTAMAVWVFKQLGLPVSYSGGAKLSFGDVAEYDSKSKYFVYEADEYDRNFLSFYPEVALISGIDYDHPDIYPTRESYDDAFREFFDQSNNVVLWHDDAEKLGLEAEPKFQILAAQDPQIEHVKLPGLVNRQDAWLVARGLAKELGKTPQQLIEVLNKFPGISRRFEKIATNIYSDSAHTPPKIRGALQLAFEVLEQQDQGTRLSARQGAGEQRTELYDDTAKEQSQPATQHSAKSAGSVAGSAGKQASAARGLVVVYEGLHNLRQHFIKDELKDLFNGVKELYIVPSYLAREDPNLPTLSPVDLVNLLSNSAKEKAHPAQLDEDLKSAILKHSSAGDLVLCLSAGGAGSLDEWLRKEFK